MFLENGVEIKESSIIEDAISKARENLNAPLVVIRCITYNQANYISESLEGFINQKTNFSYVAIVHDDVSNDGTRDIIQRYSKLYPEIIKPVLDIKNRYSDRKLGYVMDLLIDAYSPKYIAYCEGDDVWSNPLKLQKQVDYMESHPECVMCHGDYEIINGKKRKTPPHHDEECYFGPGHVHSYTISSLTALYRYDAYKRIPHYSYSHHWLMGDYPLWIELSREGKFHFIPEIFGKYRVLPNSASHSTDCEQIKRFWENENEITRFYSELYGYEYKEKPLSSLYSRIQNECFDNHDIIQARKYWKEGNKNRANNLKSFLFFFSNVYKQRWIVDLAYRIIG